MPPRLRQSQTEDPTWQVFLTLVNEKKPLSASQIARLVGLPRNTTYYHLEALRKSGLALRDGKLWLGQPLFLEDGRMDLVLPAWQVLVLATIEKMVVPQGASKAATTRGCLSALGKIFDVPDDSP